MVQWTVIARDLQEILSSVDGGIPVGALTDEIHGLRRGENVIKSAMKHVLPSKKTPLQSLASVPTVFLSYPTIEARSRQSTFCVTDSPKKNIFYPPSCASKWNKYLEEVSNSLVLVFQQQKHFFFKLLRHHTTVITFLRSSIQFSCDHVCCVKV